MGNKDHPAMQIAIDLNLKLKEQRQVQILQ